MATRTWDGSSSGAWDTALNWTPATVPVDDDDVIIPASATQDITTDLDQSDVTLASFTIEHGATIDIGSQAGHLLIGGAAASIWHLGGSGSYWMDIAGDAGIPEIHVDGTGFYSLNSYAAQNMCTTLKITNASATVWIAEEPVAVAEVATIQNGGATLLVGDGVTGLDGAAAFALTTSSGTVTTASPMTVLTVTGGTVTVEEGAIATLNAYAGVVYHLGGTITAANVFTDGNLDFSKRMCTCAVTAATLQGAATYNDPYNRVLATTAITFNGTSTATATVNVGQDLTFTVS